MIGESLGNNVLTARKNVKVLPTLQLPAHPSIFALGDIIDWNEQKQAFKSYSHGSVITANILSLLSGSKAQKKYKTGTEIIIVTNGRVSFDCSRFQRVRMIYHPCRTVAACISVRCGG